MFRIMLVGSITALMLLVSHVRAQKSEDLESVLRKWEKVTRDVKSVSCRLEREVIDKAVQSRETAQGLALFLRGTGPDELNHFRFELKNVKDATSAQKFIGGGRFLYSYEPANKVVRVFHLAAFKAAVLDRISLLSFIFEMDAEQTQERYHLDLVSSDVNYHYLRVRPKRDHDKRDFTEARISLNRVTGLPSQIWYQQTSGSEITWNFLNMKINSDQVEPRLFDPAIPEGWRLERLTTTR